MESGRASRNAEAGPSRAGQPTPTAQKARKKAKPASKPKSTSGTVPQPYLALAPRPISSLSTPPNDIMRSAADPNIFPSAYVAPRWGRTSRQGAESPAPPATVPSRQGAYAAGLLAPPAIVPGGQSGVPRIQGVNQAAQNARKRPADRVGVGGTGEPAGAGAGMRRRSEDRLRDVAAANVSMLSLGQLGSIMETDPQPEEPPQPAPQRRRRRVVRGETGGLTRRPTVSSREEGLALGLSRGASMRRLNVWDDLPESNDPPPAFPFPSSTSNRLPPTFEATEQEPPNNSGDITPTANPTSNPLEPPRSPPPPWEQVMGLEPMTQPPDIGTPNFDSPPLTPRHRPSLSLAISSPVLSTPHNGRHSPETSSPTSTHYASAPSSPLATETELVEEERADRKMWNSDLLAGYTFEQRVQRELARQEAANKVAALAVADSQTSAGKEEGETEIDQAGTGVPFTSEAEVHTGGGVEPLIITPDSESTPAVVEESTPVAATPPFQPPSPPAPAMTAESHPEAVLRLIEDVTPDTPIVALEPINSEPERPLLSEPSPPAPVTPTAEPPQPTLAPLLPAPSTASSSSLSRSPTFLSLKDARPRSPVLEGSTAPSSKKNSPLAESATADVKEDPDAIITSPLPRKLTRGKAIRRSSSGLKTSPSIASSRRSSRAESPGPLFSTSSFDFSSSPGLGIQAIPEAEAMPVTWPDKTHVHRLSVPDVVPKTVAFTPESLEDKDDAPRRLRHRGQSQPNLAGILGQATKTETPASALPPHREAALKRREFALERVQAAPPAPAIPSKQPPKPKRSLTPPMVSGPLIDWDDFQISPTKSTGEYDVSALAGSAADLLQLLEEGGNGAESSAQAAAKAALIRDVKAAVEANKLASPVREANPKNTSIKSTSSIKKPAPPPPPSLRAHQKEGSDALTRKASVLSSADSPIAPRPLTIAVEQVSPTPKAKGPAMPTRRPPPALPVLRLQPEFSADIPPSSTQDTAPPVLPLRPSPPAFEPRPPHPRALSSFKSETSSISEKGSNLNTSPPIWQFKSRPGLPARPKGPRPPPVPPRPWAKIVSQSLAERSPERSSLSLDDVRTETSRDERSDSGSGSGSGSGALLDRASVPETVPRRQVEYTDLDVLVSRLESSGREYEGFTQITSFLGPAKSPAATSRALATLLPGPITVDSRRTTPQGKIKLKLSLLGVRVTKCPICLAQFREKEKGILLPDCGHVGHEVCALRWFKGDGRCFVCREGLRESEGVL